jgi:hypothetical protein
MKHLGFPQSQDSGRIGCESAWIAAGRVDKVSTIMAEFFDEQPAEVKSQVLAKDLSHFGAG